MSTRKPKKPTGRVAFDDQGNAKWEWRSESGTFNPDIDTQRLKAIGADFSVDGSVSDEVPLHDPYNRPAPPTPQSDPLPKKRTMADLRRLSEQIKAAREKKPRG